MTPITVSLAKGKKVYFASDFHLGVPSPKESLIREQKIIRWLDKIESTAQLIILAGDIFDFWYEYKRVIPKGYIRLLGKLAQLTDKGIPIMVFTGNHDMWMFDYLEQELNIKIFRNTQRFQINEKQFLVGHGDGLGPGDTTYKLLKKIFRNKLCIWLFGFLHPDIGLWIANSWSRKSRVSQLKKEEFLGENEWLLQYCRERELKEHFDYYIFGHRHLPLSVDVSGNSKYINLGEWMNYCTYAVFDGSKLELLSFSE